MSRIVLAGTSVLAACLSPVVATAAPVAGRELVSTDVVFRAGLYGREHSLPICDWSTRDRTLLRFIVDPEEVRYGPFSCRKLDGGQDSCTWTGSGAARSPSNSEYRIVPRDIDSSHYQETFSWPDGSGLYDAYHMQCRRPRRLGGHQVVSTSVDGQRIPGGETCDGFDDPSPWMDVVLADVDAGTVDHVRTAYVRGSVTLALGEGEMDRMGDDVELAIQQLVDGVWRDAAVAVATAEAYQQTVVVEGELEPLADVRLQVRGRYRCFGQGYVGYDIRDARIFVETCVPDQSNPGECL